MGDEKHSRDAAMAIDTALVRELALQAGLRRIDTDTDPPTWLLRVERDSLRSDALLPLDVWQKWPDVSFAQTLSPEVVSHVQLTARQLDLAAALRNALRVTGKSLADATVTPASPTTLVNAPRPMIWAPIF